MVRTIRKIYRIAYIAFGQRRAHGIILMLCLGAFLIAYQNQFEISKIAADIMQLLKQRNI